jgi:hypothetical protein
MEITDIMDITTKDITVTMDMEDITTPEPYPSVLGVLI